MLWGDMCAAAAAVGAASLAQISSVTAVPLLPHCGSSVLAGTHHVVGAGSTYHVVG